MRKIFAIGGGELRSGEIFSLHKIIVEASNKKHPKLLFIPTASSDAIGYIESIRTEFGDKLLCEVDELLLISSDYSNDEIRSKILSADIIYVGGGNTRLMINTWKKYKVDEYLKEAYEKGIIMSGLSAGSICWFSKGHSDSDTYETGEKSPYSIVEGLGFIPIVHCPHHDENDRADDFDDKVLNMKMVGLALENNCAIEIIDNQFRILRSKDTAKAFKVYEDNCTLIREEIIMTRDYRDIDYLLE